MTKVLLLEGEMLVALDLELNLRDLGMEEVHVANSVDDALALLESCEIGLAVIDYNPAGETAEPVLLGLEARGVPFLVMAGYPHHSVLLADARLWPLLAKPASPVSLRTALAALKAKPA